MKNHSVTDFLIPGFDPLCISEHANERMKSRNIDKAGIGIVLEYGREFFTKGAIIYALGKKEIAQNAEFKDILNKYEGLQVVCSLDGEIITAYRNKNFKKLRPGLGRGRFNPTTNLNKNFRKKG